MTWDDSTSPIDASPIPETPVKEIDEQGNFSSGTLTESKKRHEAAGTPRAYTGPSSVEEQRLELNAKARAARDAISTACTALSRGDEDSAESNYFFARDTVLAMWEISAIRARPYRRLLKLLDAALRRSQITDFDTCQQAELRFAFDALCATFLDEEHVSDCNRRFAHSGIDILGPVRQSRGKRLRVRIEEQE